MPELEKVDVNDQYKEKYGFHDEEKPVFKSRRKRSRCSRAAGAWIVRS